VKTTSPTTTRCSGRLTARAISRLQRVGPSFRKSTSQKTARLRTTPVLKPSTRRRAKC
jgi:hypothetical protein